MFGNGDSTQPGGVSPSLNRFRCPQQESLGIPETTKRILARPYVRFAPGRATRLESDPARATASVSGSDPDRSGSCRLELWVPDTGRGAPRYGGSGVTRVRALATGGGWTVTACARGDWALRPSE
jgi:hypothetical protein